MFNVLSHLLQAPFDFRPLNAPFRSEVRVMKGEHRIIFHCGRCEDEGVGGGDAGTKVAHDHVADGRLHHTTVLLVLLCVEVNRPVQGSKGDTFAFTAALVELASLIDHAGPLENNSHLKLGTLSS